MTWLRPAPPGLSSTGFIAASGSMPAAAACIAWARPISPPSRVTTELSDMFCALNGATLTPRRASHRQIPAVTTLFPASDVVPATSRPFTWPPSRAVGPGGPPWLREALSSAPGHRNGPRGALCGVRPGACDVAASPVLTAAPSSQPPRVPEVGDRRRQQRRGDDHRAGEADRAVDVGGRRRRAVAEGAPAFGPALVDVGAAEPDPERPRERGFAAPGVRAGMRATVAAECAQGAAPAPAGHGR